MASEYKEISLSRLLLDYNNPRHQPMASQAEIIAYPKDVNYFGTQKLMI